MRVIWHELAESDLMEACDYLLERNRRAALDFYRQINKGVERLAKYPAMGRAGRVEGTREMVVANTRYVVAYMVDGDLVVILRVLHGARHWPDEDEIDDEA